MNLDIKLLRKEQGITQLELAEKAGISLRTIQRIENKEVVPQLYTLRVLSKAFGLNYDLSSYREKYIDPKNLSHAQQANITVFLLSFLPVFNLLILRFLQFKNRSTQTNDTTSLRILSFQLIWTVLFIFTCISFPIICFLFTGQRMVGEFPVLLAIYTFFIFVQIIFSWFVAYKLNKLEQDPIKFIPQLIQ